MWRARDAGAACRAAGRSARRVNVTDSLMVRRDGPTASATVRQHERQPAAAAARLVPQPVAQSGADGPVRLAAGLIEAELAAGEGLVGLVDADLTRAHVAPRR